MLVKDISLDVRGFDFYLGASMNWGKVEGLIHGAVFRVCLLCLRIAFIKFTQDAFPMATLKEGMVKCNLKPYNEASLRLHESQQS